MTVTDLYSGMQTDMSFTVRHYQIYNHSHIKPYSLEKVATQVQPFIHIYLESKNLRAEKTLRLSYTPPQILFGIRRGYA